jgi:hypothetical protein
MQMELQESINAPSLRQPPTLPFGEFLASLFQAFEAEGVRYCVLRNYEGFPEKNNGNDVDLMIGSSQLPLAIRALRSIPGIRIVGYSELPAGAIAYVEGVSVAPGARSLQIDFFLSLSWKKLPYLPADKMLQTVIPRNAGALHFFVPSPVYEAITSLLATLLIGGRVKEKYFPRVQQTIAGNSTETAAILSRQFGRKLATRLVDAVLAGDRLKLLGCVTAMRASLILRSLRRGPFRGPLSIAQYYAREFIVRFSPKTLETLCILGPDGGCNAAIIENLLPMLESAAKVVEKIPLRQRMPLAGGPISKAARADSPSEGSSGAFISMANAVLWLVAEWRSKFAEKVNITLHLHESYYHDLFINPKRCRYSGPRWFARLVGKLFPSPDLWIMLDPAADALQPRPPELPSGETLRKIEAYRSFVKTRKEHIILDASKPVTSVTEEAYAAIIHMLAQRTDRKLKNRF